MQRSNSDTMKGNDNIVEQLNDAIKKAVRNSFLTFECEFSNDNNVVTVKIDNNVVHNGPVANICTETPNGINLLDDFSGILLKCESDKLNKFQQICTSLTKYIEIKGIKDKWSISGFDGEVMKIAIKKGKNDHCIIKKNISELTNEAELNSFAQEIIKQRQKILLPQIDTTPRQCASKAWKGQDSELSDDTKGEIDAIHNPYAPSKFRESLLEKSFTEFINGLPKDSQEVNKEFLEEINKILSNKNPITHKIEIKDSKYTLTTINNDHTTYSGDLKKIDHLDLIMCLLDNEIIAKKDIESYFIRTMPVMEPRQY